MRHSVLRKTTVGQGSVVYCGSNFNLLKFMWRRPREVVGVAQELAQELERSTDPRIWSDGYSTYSLGQVLWDC